MGDSSPAPAAGSLVRFKPWEERDADKEEPWIAQAFGAQFCNFLHLVLAFSC